MRYLLGPLGLALGLVASAAATVLWALAARAPERARLAGDQAAGDAVSGADRRPGMNDVRSMSPQVRNVRGR